MKDKEDLRKDKEDLSKDKEDLRKDKEDLRRDKDRPLRQINANKSLAAGLYIRNHMGIV